MFNAKNFIRSFSPSISIGFGAVRLEMCLAALNRQKIHKNPYFSIHDYPRSLNSVAIESQCTFY